MYIKPVHIEVLDAKDGGQGLIFHLKVKMPDGKEFKLICTAPEYEALIADGLRVD